MEQLELLKASAREIKQLRAANREMSIRLEMFDHCMVLLNAAPQRQGMTSGPDIVYDIDKYLEEQKKMAFEKQQAREAEEKAAAEKLINQLKPKQQ